MKVPLYWAENKGQGSSVTSALWATPLGEEGITTGAPRDHPGSPRLTSAGTPTRVSVAVLYSPARTGRATSNYPPPNSAFPQNKKASFAFLSYLIRMPAPTRSSSRHPSRRNQPVLPNFRNPIPLRTDFDRYPPRYVGSRNQKEEQGNSTTFDSMILVTALRSDLYPSVSMGRILPAKVFRMTLGDRRQTNPNNPKSGSSYLSVIGLNSK